MLPGMFVRRIVAPVVCLIALGACRKTSAVEGAPSTMATYDGTIDDVLTQLAARSHTALVIDPGAHVLASCARLRISIPAGANLAQLPDLVGSSLRGVGMTLTPGAGGWVVSQPGPMRGPYPRECFGRGLASSQTPPLSNPLAPLMPVAPPPPFPSAPYASGDAGLPGAFANGVTARSETEFELTAAARDQLFSDLDQLTRQVRIMPVETAGTVTGVRIFGVRRNSSFSTRGFQNGDEVQRVDGTDISSPDHALEAYARVRAARECTVDVVRRGAPLQLHYRVVH